MCAPRREKILSPEREETVTPIGSGNTLLDVELDSYLERDKQDIRSKYTSGLAELHG